MNDEMPRSGTTASVDARVGRLEVQFDGLDRKVDEMAVRLEGVGVNLSHIGQLLTTQHQALTAELALVRGRYHEVAGVVQSAALRSEQAAQSLARIERQLEKGADAYADPAATPAGRVVLARIDEVDSMRVERDGKAEKIHDELRAAVAAVAGESSKNRLWIATATGALAVIMVLVNLLAPAVRAVLGIH